MLSRLQKAGLIAFAGGYAYSSLMAAAVYRDTDGRVQPLAFIPMAGPFLALSRPSPSIAPLDLNTALFVRVRNVCPNDYCPQGFFGAIAVAAVEVPLYLVAPLVQAAGLGLALFGGDNGPSSPSGAAGVTADGKRFFSHVMVAPMIGAAHGLTLSWQ